MKRLPPLAFALLALATVGAFFLVAAIKVTNPFYFGNPKPTPAAFNPVAGRYCVNVRGQELDYRRTTLTFSVGHTDSVGVYVVSGADPSGDAVATISSNTQMRAGLNHPHTFTWNGRLNDGSLAPAGQYFFRILLNNEGRTLNLSDAPIEVVTSFPHPRVLAVRLAGSGSVGHGEGSSPGKSNGETGGRTGAPAAVIAPPSGQVKVQFTAGVGHAGPPRRVWLDVYRTDLPGRPSMVAQLPVQPTLTSATWNGEVDGAPAPAGIYRIGITAQDAACDQVSNHAAAVGTGVTVRYLSVTPPLTPVAAGSSATVSVDSPLAPFAWKLRRTGAAKVLARGGEPAGDDSLNVSLPKHQAALYTLTVTAGASVTEVPIVAYRPGRAGVRARVLVVVPLLSWLGQSSVDDAGDGLPSTLAAGDAVPLTRPLVGWPGASALDDAQLLRYLNAQHDAYQLTTDVALAEATGPSLVDRWGVLLPDGFAYLPNQLRTLLDGFVKGGGRLLVLGTGALAGAVSLTGYPAAAQVSAPRLSATDLFGAQRGPVSSTGGALIVELQDQLHVLGGLSALTGFTAYQPIEPPAGVPASAFGVASGTPAVAAFTVGSAGGAAVEVGLPDFGSSLAGNVDAQELLDSVWPLLSNTK